MKPIAQALVREKCQQVVEENDLPQVLIDNKFGHRYLPPIR
jgi:hypothetical protein